MLFIDILSSLSSTGIKTRFLLCLIYKMLTSSGRGTYGNLNMSNSFALLFALFQTTSQNLVA